MSDRTTFKVDFDTKTENDADNGVRAHIRKVLSALLRKRKAALAEEMARRAAEDGYRLKR